MMRRWCAAPPVCAAPLVRRQFLRQRAWSQQRRDMIKQSGSIWNQQFQHSMSVCIYCRVAFRISANVFTTSGPWRILHTVFKLS